VVKKNDKQKLALFDVVQSQEKKKEECCGVGS